MSYNYRAGYSGGTAAPVTDNSKLRDQAWPAETKNAWGTDKEAVRNFLKTEWKKENTTTPATYGTECDAAKAAKAEADAILQWWHEKYCKEPRPGVESQEFAGWLIEKYRSEMEEQDRLDPFDNKGAPPRSGIRW